MANMPSTSFSFQLGSSSPSPFSPFGPRFGKASLKRNDIDNTTTIDFDTPGLITTTSRGVIPHLSRDHHNLTQAIRWVHVPFESFLDHSIPVPTLIGGINPLHTFLGYSPSKQAVLMSVRDPFDGRELPPNGNDYISTCSLRGVRKISASVWRSHVMACIPDIVVALSDIPFTKPPYSQKRITKSLNRSITWLSDILRPIESIEGKSDQTTHPLNVLVHMAGGTNLAARSAFSHSLLEILHDKEAEAIKPLKSLNDGVAGYVFDLVPLRLSLVAETAPDKISPPDTLDTMTAPTAAQTAIDTSLITPLLQASLRALPADKLRLVNSAISPHEVLRLIRDIGIDVFDAHWAQRAADIGVALDFRFPVVTAADPNNLISADGRKQDLGHNLYDSIYAHDFKKLADCFSDGASSVDNNTTNAVCPCAACSPAPPSTHILHSVVDTESYTGPSPRFLPPFTRAYLHHLLHTHEMSSHSLLVMHNLSVFDAFLSGVRTVLAGQGGAARFRVEVDRFVELYDETMAVFDVARKSWTGVEMARGKGRLARERAKQTESTLGTAVEL